MDDGTLCSIGELAQRTRLTVKTIRFYSDRGIVVSETPVRSDELVGHMTK